MTTSQVINTIDHDSLEGWSVSEKIFARFSYPIVLVVALSAHFYLTANGIHPQVAIIICVVSVVFFVIVCERRFPNREEWNHSQDDVSTDAAHNFLYFSLSTVSAVLTPIIVSTLYWVLNPILSSQRIEMWPHNWPVLAQLAFALVVAELIMYWVHRAHHTIPILWRLHAIHHSPNRLYWLNTARYHGFNALIDILTVFVPLVLLGISYEVLLVFLLFTAVTGYFQHGNMKVSLGPLNWIISGPQLHRWHHSSDPEESSHNYGQTLILWDIVFGTRYLPKHSQQPKSIGILHPNHFPKSFIEQQIAPFKWEKILKNEI